MDPVQNLPATDASAPPERFVDLCQQQTLARAHTEELRESLFADERLRLSRERQQLAAEREQWERRREREQQRLTHEADQIERQRQAVSDAHHEINGELDLNRRRLEASWNQFRKEQHDWQGRQAEEASCLAQRQKELERRERALDQARRKLEQRLEDDHAVRRERTEELERLGQRIRHHRQKLAGLQDETALLESRLTQPGGVKRALEDPAPAHAGLRLFDPAGNGSMLDQLMGVVEELHDESRRLLEEQSAFAELHRAWENHRADIACRAETLAPREAAVRRAEDALQRQALDLDREQLALRQNQARLAVLQGAFQDERSRLVALIKARGEANRQERQLLIELQSEWIAGHGEELKRLEQCQEAAETARREWLRLAHVFERQLSAFHERERQLHEREMVLKQAQEQLIAGDPQPAAAAEELERRRKHWVRLASRPLRGLRRKQQLLQRRHADLERLRSETLAERQALDADRSRLLQIADQLRQRQADQAVERSHWQHALAGLHEERGILEKRIRDLEQQLERLAGSLVAQEEPKPLLSLAA